MKIINLGRGQGKTTRLLYASEFNDAPILCSSLAQKNVLLHMAKELHLNIPEPLCVGDVFSDKIRGNRSLDNGILVDDTESVLQQMLYNIGLHSKIKAMSITDIADNNRYTSSNRHVSWNVEKLKHYDKAIQDCANNFNTISNTISELSDSLSTTKYWDVTSANNETKL